MASMLTGRPLLLLLWFEGLYMRFGGREGFLDSTRACLLRFFAICSIRRSGSWGMRICGALPEIRWSGGASGVLAQVYFAPIFFSRRMSSSISWIFTSILHFNSWSMIFSFDINVEFPFFFSFFFWEQSLNLVRCYGLVWFRFLWRSCHLELIKNVRWS